MPVILIAGIFYYKAALKPLEKNLQASRWNVIWLAWKSLKCELGPFALGSLAFIFPVPWFSFDMPFNWLLPSFLFCLFCFDFFYPIDIFFLMWIGKFNKILRGMRRTFEGNRNFICNCQYTISFRLISFEFSLLIN